MVSVLHQITMSYSVEQDRVLLRVGTTDKMELQMWLTRRFVRVLWSALVKMLEDDPALRAGLQPKAKEAVMAMEHQEALGAADFTQSHEKDYQDMTKKSGPLLIVGGTVKQDKAGITQLNFQPENGSEINLTLNKKLLHALCGLLIKSSRRADWNLDLTVGDATNLIIPEDKTQVH